MTRVTTGSTPLTRCTSWAVCALRRRLGSASGRHAQQRAGASCARRGQLVERRLTQARVGGSVVMGMIERLERLERIEQRMPNRVRAAVWGSLRVPHRVVRRRVVAAYLATHSVRKLQIGCGGNLLSGWLNSDLNPVRSLG